MPPVDLPGDRLLGKVKPFQAKVLGKEMLRTQHAGDEPAQEISLDSLEK